MHVLRWVGLVVMLVGCAATRLDTGAERAVVDVELLVFSGRDNPQWKLSDAEVDELIRRVNELTPGPPPQAPGLGYGGFRITTSGRADRLPEAMTIYHGVRLVRPDGQVTCLDDSGLERWLLGLARQRDYGQLLDELGL
jgi:hypothetical protein